MNRLRELINSDNRFKFIELFCRNCKQSKDKVTNNGKENCCNSDDINKVNLTNYSNIDYKRNNYIEYIVIPGINNPRWVVKNNKNAINNLGFLVKPTSMLAKYIWKASLLVNKVGLFGFIYKSRVYAKTVQFERAIHTIVNDYDIEMSAIYTGARANETKLVVQLTKQNKVTYYCKIGITKKAINEIKYERSVINRLSDKFKFIKLPAIINNKCQTYNNHELMIMRNIVGEDTKVDLSLSQLDDKVLFEISVTDEREISRLTDLINELELIKCSELQELILEVYKNPEIVLAPAHGDYIPWNRVKNHNNMILLDWENYGYYPLFYDHVNFIVHVSALIKKEKASHCLGKLVKQVKSLISLCYLYDLSISDDKVGIYITSSLLYIYSNYAENINYKEDIVAGYVEELIYLNLRE